MNIGLALVFGVLYWLATNKLWYGTLHLVRQPLVLAVPIGLIMGNLGDAMKIGASLQLREVHCLRMRRWHPALRFRWHWQPD